MKPSPAFLFLLLISLSFFGPSCALMPSDSPEIVLVEFPVLPEQRDAFIEELHGILPATRDWEGCLAAEVWTASEDADKVWIYEEWTHREAQQSYVAWRGASGTTAHLGPYIQGPVRFLWITEHHPVESSQ